jgi:hypothetical protein
VTYDFNNTGRGFLGVSFIASVKSNFKHKSNYNNATGNNCIISNAQNTAAQPSVCTSATGHKQGTVGSPQRKSLPRSTANTTASNKYFRYNFTENTQLRNTSTSGIFIELPHVLIYVVNSLVVYFVSLKMVSYTCWRITAFTGFMCNCCLLCWSVS